MRTYRHAVLGGTFDHLHVGHEALLATAFRVGRSVAVGITTPSYLRLHPKPLGERVEPYSVRLRSLRRWLQSNYPHRRWETVPLDDRFGRSVEEGVDVLVVSAETVRGGAAVNTERRRLGRKALPVVVVPIVLADDLGPVSSRRVRAGEIGPKGHRLSPISVGAFLSSLEDAEPVVRAVLTAFPSARVDVVTGPSHSHGPARTRSRKGARIAGAGRDLGVAVVRGPRGEWTVVERTSAVELPARHLPAGRPSDLRRELIRLLRPPAQRKLFGRVRAPRDDGDVPSRHVRQ